MEHDDETARLWRERTDRLEQFIEAKYRGNKSKFARAAGITPQTLNDYTMQGSTAGSEMLVKWMRAGLNPAWYLAGVGSMDFSPAQESELSKMRQQQWQQLTKVRHMADELREELDKIIITV